METISYGQVLQRVKQKAHKFARQWRGERAVHLLHIGKTGGSAVKHVLRAFQPTGGLTVHLHDHRTKFSDIPEGESVMFFVRHPVARFVSGFYSRQRQGQPRYFSPWSEDEKLAFEQFRTANELATALGATDRNERECAHRAMSSIEHVRSQYSDWLGPKEYVRSRKSDIFFIGSQEHLTEDFETLKRKLLLPELARLPDDEISAHRNPAAVDKKLTAEAVGNLCRWYQDDFDYVILCNSLINDAPALALGRTTLFDL